jgi:hypothetical protein
MMLVENVRKIVLLTSKRASSVCVLPIGSMSSRHYSESVNENLIPSISETDSGSLGFRNSTWRKNKNWKHQFAASTFLPHAGNSNGRGLFGNLLLDVSDCHGPALNKIVFNMAYGTQQYMIHDMRT